MSDRRQKNVEIFEDTRRFYNEEPFLRESIQSSIAATASLVFLILWFLLYTK